MKRATNGPLANHIETYLAHKRSLGKQLAKVGPMLQLLDGYLLAQGVAEIRQITAAHIDAFVASRSRHSPRSYNGLIGIIRRLLDWMVGHEVLVESPLRCGTRRVIPPRRVGDERKHTPAGSDPGVVLQRPPEASTWTASELENKLRRCDATVVAIRRGSWQEEGHPTWPRRSGCPMSCPSS